MAQALPRTFMALGCARLLVERRGDGMAALLNSASCLWEERLLSLGSGPSRYSAMRENAVAAVPVRSHQSTGFRSPGICGSHANLLAAVATRWRIGRPKAEVPDAHVGPVTNSASFQEPGPALGMRASTAIP